MQIEICTPWAFLSGVRFEIRPFWLLLFLIAALSLACNLPLNLAQQISPLPTPTPPQFTLGPTSVSSGLSELKSYRTSLTLDFAGHRNGESGQGHIEALTEVTQQPPAFHHTFTLNGHLPKTKIPTGVSEFYQINDQIYLKKAGDNLWSQFAGSNTTPDQMGFLALERLITLPRVVSTPPVTKTLNGLDVQHYHFSEADLSNPNFILDQAQGEVWVATHRNYVVQYTLSTTLRVTLPDPQANLFDRGQLTLHYALTDVNADFTIFPPVNIPTNNTLSNLPPPPDARLISAFPDLVEYRSSASVFNITQFYQEKLPTLEWAEEHATVFKEKARLTFVKEGQILTIIITPSADPQIIKVLLDITP
jgi:hypothetical protein